MLLAASTAAIRDATAQDAQEGESVVARAQVEAALADDRPVATFGESLINALDYNPAVRSAYFAFEAARAAESVVRGGFLPSVDLGASYGREERQTPIADFGDYTSQSLNFSVTQLLFDGMRTRDTARARNYEKLARYYDFHAAAQQVALDATEAYLDTALFQRLVLYAEQNYVVHRQLYNKIAERANSGISQRVDLEQATARMALAESNLLTEVTNLHDTRAEFQRVVGRLPVESLPLPEIPERALPASRVAALNSAYAGSPEINRAIEELRSNREDLNATRGAFMPRLDLRYRNEDGRNTDGIRGDFDLEAIEVVMSYNLYRGGADAALRREQSNRYYSAIEARKQACLNVRRETVIAYNDIEALTQQVAYLSQQLESQDRTRRAYGDQFDLGQRSLLDLLDSQNEYFDTQRALISARTRLALAKARTLAQMGTLTRALDVNGFSQDKLDALQLDLQRSRNEDIPACPSGIPQAVEIDQEAIFERLNESAAASDNVFK
jgi:adhesin transport system outer membrane protein